MNMKKLIAIILTFVTLIGCVIVVSRQEKNESITIVCENNSHAERWAKSHFVRYSYLPDSERETVEPFLHLGEEKPEPETQADAAEPEAQADVAEPETQEEKPAVIPFLYNTTKKGIEIVGYTGEHEDYVVIPQTIAGTEVTAVNFKADRIQNLLIPATVKKISPQLVKSGIGPEFYVELGILLLSWLIALYGVLMAYRSTDSKNRKFLGLASVRAGVVSYLLVLIWLVICRWKRIEFPLQTGVAGALLLLGVISVFAARLAAEHAARVESETQRTTAAVRALRLESDAICLAARSEESKACCTRVAEALRYADPVTDKKLIDLDKSIASRMAEFETAVRGGNDSAVRDLSGELLALIEDRNNRSKAAK